MPDLIYLAYRMHCVYNVLLNMMQVMCRPMQYNAGCETKKNLIQLKFPKLLISIIYVLKFIEIMSREGFHRKTLLISTIQFARFSLQQRKFGILIIKIHKSMLFFAMNLSSHYQSLISNHKNLVIVK